MKISHIVLIAVLGFLVYANSFDGTFLRDDEFLIADNAYVKNWASLGRIFTENIAAGGEKRWFSYRPLQMITYMADYSAWKLHPFGYHLTNTALHVLAALALYWFVFMLFQDGLLSLITGALFVVHPLHTSAVAFISGRADPLALLFMLLCLVLYIQSVESQSTEPGPLPLLVYALALLSRENALILPALILLYHVTFKKKISFDLFFPFIALSLLYVGFRLVFLKDLLPHRESPDTFLQRLPGSFAALTYYVRLLVAPFHLHMEYGNRLYPLLNARVMLGASLLPGLLFLAARMREKNRLFFFSVMWFFITLVPVSNLYPIITAFMAEHWLYVPSIGFFLLLASGLCTLYRTRRMKRFSVFLVCALVGFYSYLTVRQNDYWSDPVRFYERTLLYAPGDHKVHYNLGNSYSALGRHEEAIAPLKKSIELNPDFSYAYNNLGRVYRSLGRQKEGMGLYKKAIEIDPGNARAYFNLGNVYEEMEDREEAARLYEKAIELKPDYVDAYNNLGITYEALGRNDEAIAALVSALAIDPDFGPAYNNLALLYLKQKRIPEATACYRRAGILNAVTPAVSQAMQSYLESTKNQ